MKKIFFIIYFFILASQIFAQTTQNVTISGCPYNFTKDLQYGQSGKDIYVLQKILNSDRRTSIASAGVGAPGMESNYFGKGTREALKRFQALFIEYVGIADGKFSGRTREMLQAVCDGKNFDLKNKNVDKEISKNNQTEIPKTPLQIKLSLNSNTIPTNTIIKIFFTANKEVKPITPDVFIVDGGSISEIRKLSKTEYFAMLTPDENARKISVQIEADRIEDLDGMKNEEASNEITLTSSGNSKPITNSSSTLGNIANSLQSNLDQILFGLTSSFSSNTPSQSGSSMSASQPSYANYSPASSPSNGGSAQGGNGGFSQMLSGLLGGFAKQQQAQQQEAQQNGGSDNGGWNQNQNINENLTEIQIPANIDPICKLHYGIDPGGSCPDVVHLTPLVKQTAMQACTVIKKKISSQSQYRNQNCNERVGGAQASSHMSGMALDINVNNLSSTERQAVFMVFKKNGFNNIGCYRAGSGNVHLDHRGGGPRRWGPSYGRDSYNPANCPKELIQVFGN